MSITTYLVLIIFMMCISLHACNARHLSTLDKKMEKKSNSSMKISDNDEKKGFDSTSKKLNEGNDNNDEKMKKTRLVTISLSDESKPSKNRRTRRSMVGKEVSSSSSSWRVPHNKKRTREKNNNNPGFNLDYSPPKTHPPSHN